MEYINKAEVVAEIERRIKGLKDCYANTVAGYAGEISGLERLLSFINTLKVEEIWKPADGDYLPEIDREVIALVWENEHYKVVFVHRPPEYWDGKNIITNEVTRYESKRYDKGGWNQPDVKFWLDCELPKIEEVSYDTTRLQD